MKKMIVVALAAAGFIAPMPYAAAQKQDVQSPYAIEDCKSGCYLVKDPNNEGATIYTGAVPRTFRICSANSFDGTLIVDGKTLIVPGTSFGVRSCQDVNALNIVLIKGTLAVGALP